MKFLAVLKDSFREATDSMVLYVMVGLSLVLILFVGGISYEPMPAKEAFDVILSDFHSRELGRKPFAPQNRFRLDEVETLKEGAQPYLGEYKLTVTAFWTDFDMLEADKIAFMKEQFELHDIDAVEITPAKDKESVYIVHARGAGGKSWLHQARVMYGLFRWFVPGTLGLSVYMIENTLVNGFGGWITILVSVIITAFFIPSMLHKGSIDLLLSKPIGRIRLLIYKYFGGLTFMFVNSSIAIGGVWLAIGLRTGIWAPGFLLSILVLTYFFAILYSISTLIGVLTRSAVISILVTVVMWVAFFVIGQVRVGMDVIKVADPKTYEDIPGWAITGVKVAHAITPRTTDLDYLITNVLTKDLLSERETRRLHADKNPEFSWTETFAVSGAFISIMLGLACWRFWARDY